MCSIVKNIKGRDWTFNFLTQRQFNKKNPRDKNFPALANPNIHEVDIVVTEVNFRNVIHELLHCYYFECENQSTNPTPLQVEETVCDLVGTHYFDLGKLASEIINYYLENQP